MAGVTLILFIPLDMPTVFSQMQLHARYHGFRDNISLMYHQNKYQLKILYDSIAIQNATSCTIWLDVFMAE